MGNLKITIGNYHIPTVKENYICEKVDVADFNEVSHCIEQCIGKFLEVHENARPDLEWHVFCEECYFTCEII